MHARKDSVDGCHPVLWNMDAGAGR
jgi:hypothetical protein